MKILELMMPNKVLVNALLFESFGHINLCYAQNRIFVVYYSEEIYYFGEIITEYAVIPKYDSILKDYEVEGK